jgi:uncharacterized protein (TIRG00374 family)
MKKKILNVLFFLVVMGLTIYAVLSGNDLNEVMAAVDGMNKLWLIPAVVCALLFVLCEGFMIQNLLRLLGHENHLLRCFSYSFIGYFYSGITPSASGGQPLQLYYMRQDGNNLSDSSVVLLTVAFFSRFVLTVIGILLMLFCHDLLAEFFQGYLFIYYLGLIINTLVAAVIVTVMVAPGLVLHSANIIDGLLIRLHILKPSSERRVKIIEFVDSYRGAVKLLMQHKEKIAYLFFFTLFQRITLYILTWFVYKGFGLTGTGFFEVVLLQAAIYVAVEMLPLPGAQGITELLYHNVFGAVFGAMLTPSLLVVRGLDFYLLMLVSLVFVLYRFFRTKKIRPAEPSPTSGE